MKYNDLLNEHLLLKEKFSKISIPQSEIISFSGVDLHEDLDITTYQDDKLLLAHSCIHTLFSKKNKDLSKERVFDIHNGIRDEMTKRGIEHTVFDKLDTNKR